MPRRAFPAVLCAVTLSTLPAPAPADEGAASCSAEQLRSLASGSFLPEAIGLCATLAPLARAGGLLGEDPRFEAFAEFCEGRGSIDFACTLTDDERTALRGEWREILASAERRKTLVQGLCGRLEQAAAARDAVPEAERARFDEGVAAMRAACAPGGGIPSEDALAVVQAASALGDQARRLSQTPPPSSLASAYAQELARARGTVEDALRGGQGEGSHGTSSGGLPRGIGAAESARDEGDGSATGGALSSLVPGSGVLDLAVGGLANVLAARARTELESAAVDRLEGLMCRGGARAWFGHTCAFFAGRSPELGVRLGTGLRTAMGRDVLSMPTRAREQAPDGGGRDAIRHRLFFETLDGLLESTEPADLADRVIGTAADWRCDRGGGRQAQECRQARAKVLRAGLVVLALAMHGCEREGLDEATVFGIVRTLGGQPLGDEDRRIVRRLYQQIRALRRLATAASAAEPTRVAATDGDDDTDGAHLRRIVPIARTAVAVLNLAIQTSDRHADDAATTDGGLELPDGMPEILDAMARGQLTDVMVSTTAAISALGSRNAVPHGVVRAMAVGAELAEAQSREQVEAAVEAIAAPAGAWRQKQSKFMLSLGGLVGVQGGAEWLSGSSLPERPQGSSIGVLGAVGLDVSFPLRPGSLGVFLSVLDLGTLMSVQLQEVDRVTVTQGGERREAEVDVSTPVRIENVLSPGLYLRFGIPTLPLTLGAGASVVPRGRHVEEIRESGERVSEDVSVIRAMALLGVDVTLLPF